MNRTDAIHTLARDLQNEYSHLLFYTRQASIVGGMHAAEYREFFEKAAASELLHVLAFQDRILGLAPEIRLGDHPLAVDLPRYAALRGLTPFFHPHEALDHAIQLETDVARNYTHTIRSLDTTSYDAFPEATYLKIFYEEQLKDSYEDCERMRRLRANFWEQPCNRSWRDWTLKSADE